MFERAGLPHARQVDKVPNSRKALRLGEHARARGAFEALHRRLFEAYWAEGLDLGADEVLVDKATEAGLDEAEVREVLAGDAYLDVVERETAVAVRSGVSGVPAWVIDQRLLVAGAQPHEVFEQALEQLGYAPVDGA